MNSKEQLNEKEELRRLVLKVIVENPRIQCNLIENDIRKIIKEGECEWYNKEVHKLIIDEIIWDLLIDRVITFGSEDGNADAKYPFIRLTERGKELINNSEPHFYDPKKYVDHLESLVTDLDQVTRQYVFEAIRSFRQGLMFAAAALIGAAAERGILGLLCVIKSWEPDPNVRNKLNNLYQNPKMPSIFKEILECINKAKKKYEMPYSVHQGATEHLLSFQEMIRVQRNDAVHPAAGNVSREKVFLSLQTFPFAFMVIGSLRDWFDQHKRT